MKNEIKTFLKSIPGFKTIAKSLRKVKSRLSPKPPHGCFIHNKYGKSYFPCYNPATFLSNKYPDIYNSEGKKMELFFIRDIHFAHVVYSNSKYFQYDRYNFGLDTHIYTHNAMLETMGKPTRKYGMLVEAEIITPNDYTIFKINPGLEKDFDLIFTYSDKILQALPNARYVPYYIQPWYGHSYMMGSSSGLRENEGTLSPDNYKYKTKNISIIASGKEFVPLHKVRNSIAMKCKTEHLADTYGTFDGGKYCDISEPFKDYRFSIVIENEITPYSFTEKITNCFAAMTIPIYLGASKIKECFNPDGIIEFSMTDDIETILKQCTKEFYDERISAVIENFNRVNINKSADDIMYENYIHSDIGKLNPKELLNKIWES